MGTAMNAANLKHLSSPKILKKRRKREIFVDPPLFSPPDLLVKVQPRKNNSNEVKSSIIDKNLYNGKKAANPKLPNEKLELKLTELNSKSHLFMKDYNCSNINQQQILLKSQPITKNQASEKEQCQLHSKNIKDIKEKTEIRKSKKIKKVTDNELSKVNMNIDGLSGCSRDSRHDIDSFISVKEKLVITYSASEGRTVQVVIDEKDRTAVKSDKQEGTTLKNDKIIIRSHAVGKKNKDQEKSVSSSRVPVIIRNNVEKYEVPMNEGFIFGRPIQHPKKPESYKPNLVRTLVVLVTDVKKYPNSPHIKQTELIERESQFSTSQSKTCKNTDCSCLESQICDDNEKNSVDCKVYRNSCKQEVDKIKLEKSENILQDIECGTVEEISMNVSSKKANTLFNEISIIQEINSEQTVSSNEEFFSHKHYAHHAHNEMQVECAPSKSPEFQDLFSPDADFFCRNDAEKTK